MWNRVVKCGKTRVKGGRLSNTVSGPCCALTWWTVLVADPEADSAAGCHQGTRVPTKSLGLLWESWARSGCGAGSCPALSMAGRKVKLCPTSLLGKRKRILLLDWRLTQWPLETECRSLLEERAQWACLLCVETCLPQALLSTPPPPPPIPPGEYWRCTSGRTGKGSVGGAHRLERSYTGLSLFLP